MEQGLLIERKLIKNGCRRRTSHIRRRGGCCIRRISWLRCVSGCGVCGVCCRLRSRGEYDFISTRDDEIVEDPKSLQSGLVRNGTVHIHSHHELLVNSAICAHLSTVDIALVKDPKNAFPSRFFEGKGRTYNAINFTGLFLLVRKCSDLLRVVDLEGVRASQERHARSLLHGAVRVRGSKNVGATQRHIL